MRIVHTSDWHAGKLWKGINRLAELEAVLDFLADFIEREAIDLVLLTGDVFDSRVPPARAERAVFRFFRRIGTAGARSVVIAGNHDNAARIEAWGILAELANVHAVGRPRSASAGGVIRVPSRSGDDHAVVAAIPFAAPRTLVTALELDEDEASSKQHYAERLRQISEHLCREFEPGAVNLLCAHTHLDGARWTGSERKVHLGDDWAAVPQDLPPNAHYVALGHIHKPQKVPAPAPAYYAGSPLQLDFGEAGEEKSLVFIEAKAGMPSRIEHIPYEGGKPLLRVETTLSELERDADRLRVAGWLRVLVRLDEPDPDVNRGVRKLLPNAVSVDVDLPRQEVTRNETMSLRDHAARDVYAAYHERAHGRPAGAELLELFESLRVKEGGR